MFVFSFLQECVSTTQRLKQYMDELNGVLTTVQEVLTAATLAAAFECGWQIVNDLHRD